MPFADHASLAGGVFHEGRHSQTAKRRATRHQQLVCLERCGDGSRLVLPLRATADGRDRHDTRHGVPSQRLCGGPGKVEPCFVERLRGIGWDKPEYGISAAEGALDHRRVTMRPLHDLNFVANFDREFCRIAHGDAHVGIAGEETV